MSTLADLQLDRQLYKTQPQTVETLGTTDLSSNIDPTPSNAVASGNTVTDVNTNAEQLNGAVIAPGTIPAATLDIANFGWTQTCVFTSTDLNTVSWTSGTFTSANGVSVYSIGAGNTGNMAAKTYVYLDINVSTTAYQISTSQTDAIGIGKVFIALCENAAVSATFNLVQASQIVSDNILANTISAQKMNVAILSAISANLGAITAGTITVVGGGNTVAFTPAEAVVMVSGPTGSPNFSLTDDGELTTIGLSSLNMKSFTSFETATRFTQTVDGSGAVSFNTSGLRLETSASATSSALNKWFATQNVFNSSPTFSASIEWGAIPTIGGVGYLGLGAPATFSGSGATFTGNHIGFEFSFSTTWKLFATLNNSTTESFTLLTSMVAGDVLDLILKVNGTTSVDYYYRKNNGALTKTTITATVPSSANNQITFGVSNKGEANNVICLVYSAALER